MADKVLLIDDSEESRAAIKDAVREIFPVFIEADDGVGAVKAFVEENPSFIITDIEMPGIDGYRFISTIRNMENGKDVPIIMISAANDSLKKKILGFNLGASDYLTKPFENEELVARVKSLLRVRRLMDELKEKNALLEKLAVTDELTGIYNRRYFFDAVRQQMALGLRHHFKIACLLMDVDHFKKINDTWGHMAGDEVLRKIGTLLNSCKRDGEVLARFGGEEFVICLFNTDSQSAFLAAERFRKIINSHDFSSPIYPVGNITISIGASMCPQSPILSIDELIKAADKALYKAKSEGRDRVVICEGASLSSEHSI